MIPNDPGPRYPLRSEIASLRRDQIIDAAINIIVEQGIANLSLSKIEERAGMSRGQLTHYFPTKEDILLAVFDRTIERMNAQAVGSGVPMRPELSNDRELIQHIHCVLSLIIGREPISPEFHTLHYTFLSQVTYREDMRSRLASLYDHWRMHFVNDVVQAGIRRPHTGNIRSTRLFASFVQAIIHGVNVQLDADPTAFNRAEMVEFIMSVLEPWFRNAESDNE